MSKSAIKLQDQGDMAKHLNMVVFHTKMVDYLDEMLIETADLSIYWYDRFPWHLLLLHFHHFL